MTELVGHSDAIDRVRKDILRIAPTPLPVLVTGETGTGKEVVARMLHEASGRTGPFVPVDCAALSQQLVETELFGHERGAFTGANNRRDGLVHAARGGTFFLDEIGELPLETQTRLLRLLEAQTYRPVGGLEDRNADIRVVAATWRELSDGVRAGTFRQDLYHRLAGIRVRLPTLRDRPEDVSPLLEHFMKQDLGTRPMPSIAPSVRAHLRRWPWPGNVRELRNVARYLSAMVEGPRIRIEDLPPQLHRTPPAVESSNPEPVSTGGMPIRLDLPYMEARRELLDSFQIRYVEAQLEAHDGNISAAARAAGMDRRSIQRILKRARDGEEGT